MSFQTDVINHATGIDLNINSTTVLAITADGVERTGADYSWSAELTGANFALGGGGALAQAVVTIGSRKYNAWELPNGVTDPYLEANFWIPPGYDASNLLFSLYLFKTATATGTNIVTNSQFACIGSADSLDATLSSVNNVTTAVGANNCLFVAQHTIAPANAADGGLCHGIIQRIPTNVADNYTGSIYILGARVEYA
jgi:hypothetical protein